MTDLTPERRAELIAAALDDSLTAGERVELDRARAADPGIDHEIDDLRQMITRMQAATGHWDDTTPAPTLRARVAAIGVATTTQAPRRRRGWLVALGAAACVLIGVGGTIGVQALGDAPVTGPPGTLGAVEEVDFTGERSGMSIDGALVAHTWGTETLLEIDGLPVDDTFAVTLVGSNGERFASGTFFGSTVTIDCRMNAAVPRTDVATVEISDAAGGVVASAELPDAS